MGTGGSVAGLLSSHPLHAAASNSGTWWITGWIGAVFERHGSIGAGRRLALDLGPKVGKDRSCRDASVFSGDRLPAFECLSIRRIPVWRSEARPVQGSKLRFRYGRMYFVLDHGPRVSSDRRLGPSLHYQAPITDVDGGRLLHNDSLCYEGTIR
jgi:hypothetical protein